MTEQEIALLNRKNYLLDGVQEPYENFTRDLGARCGLASISREHPRQVLALDYLATQDVLQEFEAALFSMRLRCLDV